MDRLISILEEINIPYAYDHFAEGESVKPPFICFLLPSSDNFAADGLSYFKKNVVHIELYTDKKSIKLENKIEAVLDKHCIFYNKSEVWIPDEKLYEVLFAFDMEEQYEREK